MLSSSGSSRHWSRSALVSASPALVALGPFLSALVTRTGWYSARPVARATGLAPRWPVSTDSARVGLSPLVQLGPRHSPRSAARVRPLVSTGSARAAPLASLRSSGHRCVHLLHDLRCVHLLHDSVPWWLVRRSRAALVSAAHSFSGRSVPRARKFHWNLATLVSSTLVAVTVLTVPRVR